MAAVSDFEHLQRAPASLLVTTDEATRSIVEQLQTSTSTVLVNALRTRTMERTIIAVGTIGIFEALLQNRYGWSQPWVELDRALVAKGHADIVERFRDYRDAINVLKHGEGRSYDRLLSRKAKLQFVVKERGDAFFDEGDVSEVSRLVDADTAFVEQGVAIMGEIVAILERG